MDPKERVEAACSFILQSPPGEINDVLNDVRNIISDDESLHHGIQPALRRYNIEQLITVDVPGTSHQSVISEAARVDTGEEGNEERFLDPRSKTSFKFDHLALEASDPQTIEVDEESESYRSSLEKATLTYLSAHFQDGVSSVFTGKNPKEYIIQLVANKYNPNNFWSGRWRSEYLIDLNQRSVKGKIYVTVHYYEQGNVQLSTTHTVNMVVPQSLVSSPPATSATKLLNLIETEEGRYQTSLNDTYSEMGEKTFKGLRRALPLTRQKIEWEKVLGYKLGAEIASSRGVFGN